jgi:hypothetical protein
VQAERHNKRVNLTRRSADGPLGNRRTRRLRAVRSAQRKAAGMCGVWGFMLAAVVVAAFAPGCASSSPVPAGPSASPLPSPSLTGTALEQAIRAAVTPPARIYEFAYSPEGESAVGEGSGISLVSVGTCLGGVPEADLQQAADEAAFQVVRAWYTSSPKWDYCRVLVFDRSVRWHNVRLEAWMSRKDAAALDWRTATAADLHDHFAKYDFSLTPKPLPIPSGQ